MAYTHPGMVRATSSANSDLPTLWAFKTADALAVVEAAGYFNDAVDDLNSGDLLHAEMADGSKVYRLTVTATVVTLNPVNGLTVTTDSSTGTATTTLNDGTATYSQTITNNNNATIAAQLNAIMRALGLAG